MQLRHPDITGVLSAQVLQYAIKSLGLDHHFAQLIMYLKHFDSVFAWMAGNKQSNNTWSHTLILKKFN